MYKEERAPDNDADTLRLFLYRHSRKERGKRENVIMHIHIIHVWHRFHVNKTGAHGCRTGPLYS